MTELAKSDQVRSLVVRPSSAQFQRGAEPQESVKIRRLLLRLLQRWHYVVLALLIVVIPVAIGTYLTTPLYRSRALVQVSPDPVQVMPYRDVADSMASPANYDNYMGTQEQILNGSALQERVRQRLETEFAGQPAQSQAFRFEVRKIERSELFELNVVAPDPDAAASIVNLFAEEYVRHNFELRQDTRLQAEQDLKTELEALELRLQLSERELMAYAQANDIMSLEQGQVDPLQDRLSALSQDLVGAQTRVASATSTLQSLQAATFAEFPQRLTTDAIASLSVGLLNLEQQLTTMRGTFGEGWPAVVDKRNEVELVRRQLEQEKSAVLARNLEQARLDLQEAETRERLAQQALDEQEDLVNRFHNASIDYNILRREVATNRNLYDGLLERLRQTGVLAGLQFGNIRILEAGQPRNAVDSPNVVWNLGLATLLGLSLGVCLVLLLESLDTSISTLDDVEDLKPLPSLGNVPYISHLNGSKQPLVGIDGEANAQTGSLVPSTTNGSSLPFELHESIGAICASILLSRSNARPRTIVVTSATHAEGKTTLVSHLGGAFAQAGLRTLLVEADLRKPDLSKKFSVRNKNGLSLYLAGLVPYSASIQETGINHLSVASGGPVPPNPAGLLHSERLNEFLTKVSSEYDLVILDAPPVLSLADARILGSKADGVILVVRAGRTPKNLVRRACGLVEESGANILGMVLNGWKPDRTELSQYRYYRPVA